MGCVSDHVFLALATDKPELESWQKRRVQRDSRCRGHIPCRGRGRTRQKGNSISGPLSFTRLAYVIHLL